MQMASQKTKPKRRPKPLGSDRGRQLVSKANPQPKYFLGQPPEPEPGLDDFQRECIIVFTRAATALSLAPSIGQIYGVLFSTPDPLNLDQITARLNASRGGTFQSLRWLCQIGAAEKISRPGCRKDHFRAELNLRKLAGAFLSARIEPHVSSGASHLQRLRRCLPSEETPVLSFQRARCEQMERWHLFMSDVLPFIKTFAEKF
jgi:HTH-type transcriptional regulator, glycine betaine synthesis regulator